MNRTTANNDHTVLSLACAGGHLAVVELLLAHGADPTHRLKVCCSTAFLSSEVVFHLKTNDIRVNLLLLYSLQVAQCGVI